MLSLPATRRLARSEQGFSLIETLVAILTGLIVTAALFTILEVAMRQTSRDTDYAQATQLGRTAMTHIVDELHSSCYYAGTTPIKEESGATRLIFTNAFSQSTEPTSATWREIKLENKELIEKTWPSTSTSTYPNFTFEPSKPAATETHISEKGTVEEVEGKPLFEYEKYAPEAKGSSSTTEAALEPLTSPLKSTTAPEAASVTIRFRSLPTDAKSTLGRAADLESQVTLALSAPRTEAKITDKPCE